MDSSTYSHPESSIDVMEGHPTADELDDQRHQKMAYEYLCRLEEAKEWMQACLGETLPQTVEFEECLRNGVYLAKLSHFFSPKQVSLKGIYDISQNRYETQGLHYRHTDNTVKWFGAMEKIGFPQTFLPDTADIYDKKNMPKAVYCLHALSIYLHKLGIAPLMRDLVGKVDFTEDEINQMAVELSKYGLQLPAFSKIGGILADQLSGNEIELHAAVLAITESVTKAAADPNPENLDEFVTALQNPVAKLNFVDSTLSQPYLTNLYDKLTVKDTVNNDSINGAPESTDDVYDKFLTQSEIQSGISNVNVQHLLAYLRSGLEEEEVDSEKIVDLLSRSELNVADVRRPLGGEYCAELRLVDLNSKPDACLAQVRSTVQKVNLHSDDLDQQAKKSDALDRLNQALLDPNVSSELLKDLLHSDSLAFHFDDYDRNIDFVVRQLKLHLSLLRKDGDEVDIPPLSRDDVQNLIETSEGDVQRALDGTKMLKIINRFVAQDKDQVPVEQFFAVLSKSADALDLSLNSDLKLDYQHELCSIYATKQELPDGNWLPVRLKDTTMFVSLVNSSDYCFELPDADPSINQRLLTGEEVQAKISSVNERQTTEELNQKVVAVQSNVRGFIARRKVDRLRQERRENAAVKIQANWKGYKQRKDYNERKKMFLENEDKIVRLQATMRTHLARKKYLEKRQFYVDHDADIRKIQGFFRKRKASKDLSALRNDENPPLSVVKTFLPLLQLNEQDYVNEIEAERLKQKVVVLIRSNKQLEQDLNVMDLKIGLLVKNNITLQEVVNHGKKLKLQMVMQSGEFDDTGIANGTTSLVAVLTRQNKSIIENYQNLLYILQICPRYLARLIFAMPTLNTTKFMESVILSLFSYASNQREQYLLIQLFSTALREEIRSKIDDHTDIISGNPIVLKMIVSFCRNTEGEAKMRDFLQPVITKVLRHEAGSLNTNPVDIYAHVTKDLQLQGDDATSRPQEVSSNEEALSYADVETALNKTVEHLRNYATLFLEAIFANVEAIPYGLRYLCKLMLSCLQERFVGVQEKDFLKVIGNVVYYRYINPSIMAPDAFNMLDSQEQLTVEQRQNFAAICKILQYVSANKGFGEQAAYLTSLNPFIKEYHDKFRVYLKSLCDVQEPDDFFSMDPYYDFTVLTKPVVFIALGDLISMHKLILDHEAEVAPQENDVLRRVLNDLGKDNAPSIERLVSSELYKTETPSKWERMELQLVVAPKPGFETLLNEDNSSVRGLMLKSKRILVEILPFFGSFKNLSNLLNSEISKEQESKYEDSRSENLQNGKADVAHKSLVEKRDKLLQLLSELQKCKVVSSEDNYQEIVNALAVDIRQKRQRRYKKRDELEKLKHTLNLLQEKQSFYQDQITSYDQYIQSCLGKMSNSTKQKKRDSLKKRNQKTYKLTAVKLKEKGIVTEVENVPPNQWRNVFFDISETDTPGVFQIGAKILEANLDTVTIFFQDLLQLQHEGSTVLRLFERVSFNVNLLVFFLNKKFFQ